MFALTKRSDKPHQARNCLYRRGRGVDLLLVVGPPGLDFVPMAVKVKGRKAKEEG